MSTFLISIWHIIVNSTYNLYGRVNDIDWSNRMGLKTERKLFIFLGILCIITVMVVGFILNNIELHMVVKQVKVEGINYDAFREMKLTKELIKFIKKDITLSSENNLITKDKDEFTWDGFDSLTLSMMINQYDSNEVKSITKQNANYLLQHLSFDQNFQELREYYIALLKDIEYFPVPYKSNGESYVTFDDSWNSYRSYGGNRRHEGTDLMPEENMSGHYPVISMTDGMVEKLGWLEQGGYRIGIRGNAGAYYYYAHLDSYAPGLKLGDSIKAGQFLGYMGDSGYGIEGTTGKFLVHLHVGIYVETTFGELSINPYWILRYLDNK